MAVILDTETVDRNLTVLADYHKNSDVGELYMKDGLLSIQDFSCCCCSGIFRLIAWIRGFRKIEGDDPLTTVAEHVNKYVTAEFVQSIVNKGERLIEVGQLVNKVRGELVHRRRAKLRGSFPQNEALPLQAALNHINAKLLNQNQIAEAVSSSPIAVPSTVRGSESSRSSAGSVLLHNSPSSNGSVRSTDSQRIVVKAFSVWGHFVNNLSDKIPWYFEEGERNALWAKLNPRQERGHAPGILQDTFTLEETESAFRTALADADRVVKIRRNESEWQKLMPKLRGKGIPDSAIERIRDKANFETVPSGMNPTSFELQVDELRKNEIADAAARKNRLAPRIITAYNEIAKRVGLPHLLKSEQIPDEWFFDLQIDSNFQRGVALLILKDLKRAKNLQSGIDELMAKVCTHDLERMIVNASGRVIAEENRLAEYHKIASSINEKLFGRPLIENYFT
jgi:hypothetical protein